MTLARLTAYIAAPTILLVAGPVFYAVGMKDAGFLSAVGAMATGGLLAALSMVRSLMR